MLCHVWLEYEIHCFSTRYTPSTFGSCQDAGIGMCSAMSVSREFGQNAHKQRSLEAKSQSFDLSLV